MESARPQNDHPELASEQAYIDRAYDRLAEMRRDARARATRAMAEIIPVGGNPDKPDWRMQARYERDAVVNISLARGEQLEIGDESLCFGRLDRADGDRYYVGRRG